MKKLMVLVALMFMCHIAHAQYFCTASGTELHYVNYDEVGQSVSTETMTVKNVVRNGSAVQASYYDKVVTTKAKNNTSYTLYNWQYDKGTTVCTEDLMYGPYIDSDSNPDKYNEAHAWDCWKTVSLRETIRFQSRMKQRPVTHLPTGIIS